MKKHLLTFSLALIAMSVAAETPARVYILGDHTTVNGNAANWDPAAPTAFAEVENGEVTLNIVTTENNKGLNIYTATPEQCSAPDANVWGSKDDGGLINSTSLNISTARGNWRTEQNVEQIGGYVNIPYAGSWTIKYTDNLTKAEVDFNYTLRLIGGQENSTDGKSAAWSADAAPVLTPDDNGNYTFNLNWLSVLDITFGTLFAQNEEELVYDINLCSVGFSGWSAENKQMPAGINGKKQEAMIGAHDIAPAFPGSYVVKINHNLTEITYALALRGLGEKDNKLNNAPMSWVVESAPVALPTETGYNFTVDWNSACSLTYGTGWDSPSKTIDTSFNHCAVGPQGVENKIIGDALLGSAQPLATAMNDIKPAKAGIYQVIIPNDLSTITINKDVQTGIGETIADESVPAVYYNLQGMPVENPAPGSVCIEVRGSSVRKVIF